MNTYNAEEHLQKVLYSLKGFDEIVVCDMESTDSTVDIAKSNGCKVVTFPKGNTNICEPARDFAIHSATNDWVFVVDADEIVPEALKNYLYDRINESNFTSALAVPRLNSFLGSTGYCLTGLSAAILPKRPDKMAGNNTFTPNSRRKNRKYSGKRQKPVYDTS